MKPPRWASCRALLAGVSVVLGDSAPMRRHHAPRSAEGCRAVGCPRRVRRAASGNSVRGLSGSSHRSSMGTTSACSAKTSDAGMSGEVDGCCSSISSASMATLLVALQSLNANDVASSKSSCSPFGLTHGTLGAGTRSRKLDHQHPCGPSAALRFLSADHSSTVGRHPGRRAP